MAGGSKHCKCGVCEKNVTKTNKALLCFGNCDSWYHNTCVNVSSHEYDLFKELRGKAAFLCNKCRDREASPTQVRCSMSDKTVCPLSCTEQFHESNKQIINLKSIQSDFNESLMNLRDENTKLNHSVNSQAEAIGNLLLNSDKQQSYAGKLKCNLKLDKSLPVTNETVKRTQGSYLLKQNINQISEDYFV